MKQGILIAFEGSDGAGKTTAMHTLAARLKSRGYDVLETREPGGSPVAEQIRELLLDPANAMDARTEALLYAASRREHLISTILPALEAGKIVLSDRYLDSSLTYQGSGRELGMDTIEALNDFGLQGFRPDATLFYYLDEEESRRRIDSRGDLNRLDQESAAFFARVRAGFEQLLKQHPDRYIRIDASKSMEEVANDTEAAVLSLLEKSGL